MSMSYLPIYVDPTNPPFYGTFKAAEDGFGIEGRHVKLEHGAGMMDSGK